MPIWIGTTLSFGISLTLSYVGHHRFTYGKEGEHIVYIPRFATTTVILLIVSNVAAYVLIDRGAHNYLIASAAIAVIYPVGSLMLNTFFVFAMKR